MTNAQPSGVVVDTMVISWLFDDRVNPLADRYRVLIGPRRVLLAFHTVMELHYGALRAGWGDLRRRRLERRIAELTVVQPDDKMITACANLRVRCTNRSATRSATNSTTAIGGSRPPPCASACHSSRMTGSSTEHPGLSSSQLSMTTSSQQGDIAD
jgi:predicted nucleic acid-binding protein